ncbi:MAG: 2-amino-4-hydroxy-6-hydroxymethyldihydropteridine diphosphokinase [Pseudomonadota bacterium]
MRYQIITHAVFALGANLPSAHGKPAETLRSALHNIASIAAGPVKSSQLYATPAFPAGSGPEFVNAAAAMPWQGTAPELLRALHKIEASAGRTRTHRWEARILDLDLLAFGDSIHPDPETEAYWRLMPPDQAQTQTPTSLILPHPRLAERAFVLVPMAEIAPDWRHPATGLSVREMCNALSPEARAEIRPL